MPRSLAAQRKEIREELNCCLVEMTGSQFNSMHLVMSMVGCRKGQISEARANDNTAIISNPAYDSKLRVQS